MSEELKVLHADVKAKVDAKKSNDWFYSDTVKEHFFNPRNFLRDKRNPFQRHLGFDDLFIFNGRWRAMPRK